MRTLLMAVLLVLSTQALADRVLIIGDSISCGPYGEALVAGLARQGHRVKMYCSISSAPQNWLDGKNAKRGGGRQWPCQTRTSESLALKNCDGSDQIPKLDTLLARNPSDRVMIALGTNSLPAEKGREGKADASYARMLEAIGSTNRDCTWIGPPHLQPAKVPARADIGYREDALASFYTSLQTQVGRYSSFTRSKKTCSLIDSRAATARGTDGNATVDGIHPTPKSGVARYKRQAEAIQSALETSAGEGSGGSSSRSGSRAQGIN